MNIISKSRGCRMTAVPARKEAKRCRFPVRDASMEHLVNALQNILGSVTEEQDNPLLLLWADSSQRMPSTRQIREEKSTVLAASALKLTPTPHPLPAEFTDLQEEILAVNIVYYSSIVVILAVFVLVAVVSSLILWWMRKRNWGSCYRNPATIRYKKVQMKDPDDEKEGSGSSAGSSPIKQAKFFSAARHSPSSSEDSPQLEISAGHLILSYIEDHLRNRNKLEEEWQGLETYVPEDVSTSAAHLPQNRNKNRYPEVLPYDHTRVKLNREASQDYINASYVYDTHSSKPEYIVSQAPLVDTVGDFWQMVWEQNVSVIVMLTALSDRGMPQCYQYWPSAGSRLYSPYKVQLVSEHMFNVDYVVRSFYVQNTKMGGSRTVTQLHYLTWSSFGVPATPKPLLEFRRKVHKAMTDDSPMLVHCSDGIGRSGTFCLVDMSIRRVANAAKEINLAATVEHLRDQRPNMVKTKEQYEFALTALVEETQSLLRGIKR